MILSRRLPISRRSVIAGLAATGTLVMVHPFSTRASTNQAHLRIMETTDLHVHVFPYDYYADRPNDTMGLARTASIIDQIRSEATNSLLIDNGDFLQGNPMGDYIAYERGMKDGDIHPIVAAMNVLGYDAGTLGNHEFNYGLDFLFKVLAGADFPIVCANLTKGALAADPRQDDLFLKPYVILDRQIIDGSGAIHKIRIGLIGVVPPQIMVWDSGHLTGKANARDMVAAVRAFVPQMKEEGADIVVVLAHCGIGQEAYAENLENAAIPLAAVEGVDAIVTGHSHLDFPGSRFDNIAGIDTAKGLIGGKPGVMGGFWGSHLGLIDLMLEREGGAWRVVASMSEARPIFERIDRKVVPLVSDKLEVLAAASAAHEATLAYVRTPVGKSLAPLQSYFALVTDDPSVQIVNKAQIWYVSTLLAETEWKDLPVLSAAAPFKSGGRGGADYFTDVPAGDIAIRNVADLYLYPNTVQAVLVTGAEVQEWLEMSAGVFLQVAVGAIDAELINPDFPSYNFDVIDGLTYRIDISRPARYTTRGEIADPSSSRILGLNYNGQPIDRNQKFVVASNNYRAGGGGDFPALGPDKVILKAPDTNRDVIVRYILDQGTINPAVDANWSFAPLGGTAVLFSTGPKAKNYLADLKGVTIEPAGEGARGFVRYRLLL